MIIARLLTFCVQVILAVFIVYLWTTKSFKQPVQEEKLTTEEENLLIDEWVPEPLVPPSKGQRESRAHKYLVEGVTTLRVDFLLQKAP